MKIYILSIFEKTSFAKKLLSNIKNAKVISNQIIDEKITELDVAIKKNIESADVILAIIDENFSENINMNLELRMAQTAVLENRNKLLIPVVLDNAPVPKSIEGMLYISCDSQSEEGVTKAQLMIEKLLIHRKYDVKKSNYKEIRSRTSSMIIITLAIELFAVLFVVLLMRYPSLDFGYFSDDGILTLSLGLVTIVLSVTTLFTSYLSIMKRRWQEDNEDELESYSRRLKSAIVPKETMIEDNEKSVVKEEKKEIDALGRMMINLEDIKEFYTWSQKQAKASFVLAVSMCISGFALMIAAIILPIAFKLSFQMSIIPAVGGIITELIAGTALVVYRNSLSQLNHYHKALHEDERFLSSVNLLGRFSTVEAQDDMLREIIRSEIQMNLSGQDEKENVTIDKVSGEKKDTK